MKRRLCTLLYRWIDRRGRIPRWVFWFWKEAHFCYEMDGLLILDNPEDCFCGWSKQPMETCPNCGDVDERRFRHVNGNTCMSCTTDDGGGPEF